MDTPNTNDWQHDYQEWWNSYQQEMNAKADKLDAESRMRYDREVEGLINESQAENAKDWVEADWEQFKGRVGKWWNEFEMKTDETV
jgi:hypothetical protein